MCVRLCEIEKGKENRGSKEKKHQTTKSIRAMIRASFEGRVTRGTKSEERRERGAAIADSTCLFPRSMEFTHWFHQQIHRQLAGGSNGRMKVSFRWGQPSKRSEYNI